MSRWKPPTAVVLLFLGVRLTPSHTWWGFVGITALGAFVGLTYAEITRAQRR